MPFVAELQQGKLSSAVLSFSTVEVCSSDLTHMHVIVTKKKHVFGTNQQYKSDPAECIFKMWVKIVRKLI